jgi:hypothetical protein
MSAAISHREGSDRPGDRERRDAANARARAVQRAAREVLARAGDVPAIFPTRRGQVVINSVELITEGGLDYIEVRTAPGTDSGETHFRIFNPPLGVREPDGHVRVDPFGALVETLDVLGGGQARRHGERRLNGGRRTR